MAETGSRRSPWVPNPFGPTWLREWMKRHQNPVSFALHMVGIPMTLLAIIPLMLDAAAPVMWGWAAALFVGGYALQFLGHAIEGNDAGELILIKKWLGKPYVAIAPQFQEPAQPTVATSKTNAVAE